MFQERTEEGFFLKLSNGSLRVFVMNKESFNALPLHCILKHLCLK